MILCFVDESGEPQADAFALGGIAVAEERYHELRTRWRAITARNGRNPRAEIKWARVRGNGDMALRLIDVIVECGATAFVVLVYPHEARQESPELFATGEDIYRSALTHLAERFHRSLASCDEHGVIVIDPRNEKQDKRLRGFFRELVNRGTELMSLERIIDPIMLSPSDETLGIQAVDLIVGPFLTLNRADAAQGHPRRLELARRLHEQALPCFAHDPDFGHADGGLTARQRHLAIPFECMPTAQRRNQ